MRTNCSLNFIYLIKIYFIYQKYTDYQFLCVGQISLPPAGNRLYGLAGENVTIAWKLHVNVADVQFRSWALLPNSNSFADITGDGDVKEVPQYSPGPFAIKKPATLVLKNVTIQYNGIYRFLIVASGQPYSSEVTVIVEGKCLLSTSFHPTFQFSPQDFTQFLNGVKRRFKRG